jgi:Tfp pilus assembly protein PilX
MSRLQNESGQALLLVMMVLMMLLLLGSAALTRTGSSRVRSLEQQAKDALSFHYFAP